MHFGPQKRTPARPGRGLAEASPRRQNEKAQRQSEAHGDSKLIILLLESQQSSIRNEFRTLLPCQNFRPQLAQRDRLQAGFESFKAMDCGKPKMSQDEARLEAGFSNSRQASKQVQAASAFEIEKMIEIRAQFFGLKNIRKSRHITWASPVQDSGIKSASNYNFPHVWLGDFATNVPK